MHKDLPKRLTKEPLIDALFEMRFSSVEAGSNVLPGFLFGKLDGERSIERLPAIELPKPIRDADLNLNFAPLIKLHWNQYYISIGDRSLIIGCKLPYPGWDSFKSAILKVADLTHQVGIIEKVERHSIKYVDLIQAGSISDQVKAIDLSLRIGDHELVNNSFSVRIEIQRNGLLNILNILSSAVANMKDGNTIEGVVIDVDTIELIQPLMVENWMSTLDSTLDRIHAENKDMFFDCLTKDTLENLGPMYE